MAFINLDPNLQNIILTNADAAMKVILLLMLVGVSLFYLFIYRKGLRPTEIKSIAFARMTMTLYSFFILLMAPFMVAFVHPNYLFVDLYTIFAFLYGINVMLFIWIIGLDVYRFLPAYIVNLCGIKVDSKFHNEIKTWFKRNLQ